jgi:twitching motility protein PilT
VPFLPGVTELEGLLARLVEVGGTDLVVKAGSAPHARVDSGLRPVGAGPLDQDGVARLLAAIIPPARATELTDSGETEFAYSVSGIGRFRISAYRQRGTVAFNCHRVVPGLPPADALGLPPVLGKICGEGRGLVVVTGPAGSGVTTTLCALVDHINDNRACHVVTIEAPIEYLHPDKHSLVSQREVGTDTRSVAAAVARAARQGADVVAIGVAADAEALRAALAAAEAGALVLAVVPALSAGEALVRAIEAFPESERRRCRTTLAAVLRAVLNQRLLDRADGRGRIAAFEVLLGTAKVADCIAEDRLADLPRLVIDGEYHGMQTLDRALEHLAREGLVSVRDAVAVADEPEELRLVLGSLASHAAY